MAKFHLWTENILDGEEFGSRRALIEHLRSSREWSDDPILAVCDSLTADGHASHTEKRITPRSRLTIAMSFFGDQVEETKWYVATGKYAASLMNQAEDTRQQINDWVDDETAD